MGREVWIYQLDYPKIHEGFKRFREYLPAFKKRADRDLNNWIGNANSIQIKTAEDLWNLLEDINMLENDQDQMDFPEWGIRLLFESPTKSAANSFMYQFYTFMDELELVDDIDFRDDYGSVLDVDTFRLFLDYLIILCQKAGALPLKDLQVEFTPPSNKIAKIASHYGTEDPIIQLIIHQVQNIQSVYDADPQPASLPPELDLVIRKDFVIENCLRMQEMVSDSQSNIFILDSV